MVITHEGLEIGWSGDSPDWGGAFHGIRVEPADAERREAGDGGKPQPEREPASSSGGAGRG